MLQIELILTGNELINGRILNTNARWLARRLTRRLSCHISRMSTVPDELDIIIQVIEEAIARAPDFIITSGGLGSTHDDMTLLAVSQAINRPLKLDQEAYKLVEKSYEFGEHIQTKTC